jgi:protein-S-isoprenylcysteine O-methyltransferase Ste14
MANDKHAPAPDTSSAEGVPSKDLTRKSLTGFLVPLVMAVLLFLPAGTLAYWQAWVFLFVFSTWSFAITVYLLRNDPQLLQRRLRGGPTAEKETSQKIIQTITSISFVAILVISALDHRFGWTRVPLSVCLAGDALVAFGFLIIFFVCKQNSFAASTIQVVPEQKVVSSGLYSVVRHPMYMGALILLIGMPLSLGSLWGLLVIALMTPALIWRLLDEENLLAKNLPGYTEYQSKVRYHLVPFIW